MGDRGKLITTGLVFLGARRRCCLCYRVVASQLNPGPLPRTAHALLLVDVLGILSKEHAIELANQV